LKKRLEVPTSLHPVASKIGVRQQATESLRSVAIQYVVRDHAVEGARVAMLIDVCLKLADEGYCVWLEARKVRSAFGTDGRMAAPEII